MNQVNETDLMARLATGLTSARASIDPRVNFSVLIKKFVNRVNQTCIRISMGWWRKATDWMIYLVCRSPTCLDATLVFSAIRRDPTSPAGSWIRLQWLRIWHATVDSFLANFPAAMTRPLFFSLLGYCLFAVAADRSLKISHFPLVYQSTTTYSPKNKNLAK